MSDLDNVVVHTPEIPELKLVAHGKVRSIYQFDQGLLLMVASDRISARDYVLSPGIPGKGRILNSMSTFFFESTQPMVRNHLVNIRQQNRRRRKLLDELLHDYPWLRGRIMLVQAGWVPPIEFIFRVHITGSFFKEYVHLGGPENGAFVLGHWCPPGLKNGDKIPGGPIFTPSTKAPAGEHDQNLTYDEAVEYLGGHSDLNLTKVRRVLNWGKMNGLTLTSWGYEYARRNGYILADHKIELILVDGGVELVADELFTPDSSRFLDLHEWVKGNLLHVDKEPVRVCLDEIWDGKGTPPTLPIDVVQATSERYQAIHDALLFPKVRNA